MSQISDTHDSKFNLASEKTKTLFLAWMEFQDLVDKVLKTRGYQKVQTPFLVVSGAMESQLETFKIQKTFGSSQQNLELPTSPEFHLKKALAMGLGDIFEIKTCFRNEECSSHHKAEFTMLEFYKLNMSMSDFMIEVRDVLDDVLSRVRQSRLFLNLKGENSLTLPNQTLRELFKIVSIPSLFQNIGIELTPKTRREDLKRAAERCDVFVSDDDSFDEIYFRIWLEKIEPFFNPDMITVAHSYPESQAALATLSSVGWANRFELYWQGLELGNAFEELADKNVIQTRWHSENAKRQAQGKARHVLDYEFIESLEHLPPCSGIAIGLERVFMALLGLKDIHSFDIFKGL